MWPCSVGHKVFKAFRVVNCRGTVRLRRQHLSLWHTPYTTHTKMTPFGQKYRCSVPSVSNLQHLSFLVRSVKVHSRSRWELIPKLTPWHPSCVVVYPPGTFAYITMQLPHTVTLESACTLKMASQSVSIVSRESSETASEFYNQRLKKNEPESF